MLVREKQASRIARASARAEFLLAFDWNGRNQRPDVSFHGVTRQRIILGEVEVE